MLKETWSLGQEGLFDEIHLVGTSEEGLPERERIDAARSVWRVRASTAARRLGRPGRILTILSWTCRVFVAYRRQRVRAVSCHNLASLPLGVAIRASTGALLVYDTHELESERTGWSRVTRLLAKAAERLLMTWVDYTVVVSESIGEWYRERYPHKRFRVVRNIPHEFDATPLDPAPDLRAACEIPDDSICYLVQGVLGKGRGLEILAEAFAVTRANARLVIMGFPASEVYEAELTQLLRDHPRVVRHPSVPPHRVLQYTRSADVGLYSVEPSSLSYQLTAGNKLFEYLLAGLPVIGSDFPEVRRIIEENGCGWVLPMRAPELARLLDSIDWAAVRAKRRRALEFASTLSWEREVSGMIDDYRELLSRDVIG
jgi:glycosyltransferase involved in cell wall biosynthesis